MSQRCVSSCQYVCMHRCYDVVLDGRGSFARYVWRLLDQQRHCRSTGRLPTALMEGEGQVPHPPSRNHHSMCIRLGIVYTDVTIKSHVYTPYFCTHHNTHYYARTFSLFLTLFSNRPNWGEACPSTVYWGDDPHAGVCSAMMARFKPLE